MREVPQTLANPWARTRNLRLTPSTPRIYDAPTPLRLWHLTSLDAPTVAVVWTLAFAWAAEVTLPIWVPALLALAAWAVYIGDRLLDARSALLIRQFNTDHWVPRPFRVICGMGGKQQNSLVAGSIRTAQYRRMRLRHRFHWRHRRIFLPIAVLAACAAAVIVFSCMPVAARERNSLLAAAALVYFTRVHSNRAPFPKLAPSPFLTPLLSKEMLVGLLFTAACALPVLSRAASQPDSPLWTLILPAVFFALLAWLNCHAIEHWESRTKPCAGILAPALTLGLAGLLAAAVLAGTHPRPAALLAAGALSALLLALLDHHRGRLTPLALRAAADLVLLTPIPLLFFTR